MNYLSTRDPQFLGTLRTWLQSQPEILVSIFYSHAAGAASWEFFSTFETLAARIRELSPLTLVVAYGQSQLPIRGIVDDDLIARCLQEIPDGQEYIIVETVRRVHGPHSWFHDDQGQTHAELREDLEESRGTPVAVGPLPDQRPAGNANALAAIVPDQNGELRLGIY